MSVEVESRGPDRWEDLRDCLGTCEGVGHGDTAAAAGGVRGHLAGPEGQGGPDERRVVGLHVLGRRPRLGEGTAVTRRTLNLGTTKPTVRMRRQGVPKTRASSEQVTAITIGMSIETKMNKSDQLMTAHGIPSRSTQPPPSGHRERGANSSPGQRRLRVPHWTAGCGKDTQKKRSGFEMLNGKNVY